MTQITAQSSPPSVHTARRISLPIKIAYTLFVAVMVPCYWKEYSPWNFLYFCDIAIFMTLLGMWMESRLLISLAAVSILLPQTIWVADFIVRVLGGHFLGLSDYMFDARIPLFFRGLSLFHGWLPFLVIYLLMRLGYDRRAFAWQCIFGILILSICYIASPRPPRSVDWPHKAVNINYVWGINEQHPQTWMPAQMYLAFLCGIFVVGIYLPTHLILRMCVPDPSVTISDENTPLK